MLKSSDAKEVLLQPIYKHVPKSISPFLGKKFNKTLGSIQGKNRGNLSLNF
jgi:hypothetical protein